MEQGHRVGTLGMAPWGIVEEEATEADIFCDYSVVTDLLGKLGVAPDFESDGPIRYTHRREGKTDLYFVANLEDGPVEASCTFRVEGKAPELWDPLTGQRRALPEFTERDGRTTVPMRFEAAQSFFVVFRKAWAKSGAPNFPRARELGKLTGPWEVAFDPKWGGPQRVTFDTLQDWSKRPEDGIKCYSGTAVYRTSFEAPSLPHGKRIHLNLGVVKNLARVWLNGQELGVVWCAPWRVDITSAVRARDNELQIAVANLWPNRLIGDQSLPPERRLAWTTWNPFQKDSSLRESGLLGPVTLLAEPAPASVVAKPR